MFNYNPSLGLRVRVDTLDLARLAPRDKQSNLKLLEVCQDAKNDGGITPSKDLVEDLHARVDRLSMIVVIRPRIGNFTYTDKEFSLMLHQIAHFKTYESVDGFSLAVLNERGEVDVTRMVTLLKAMEPKKLHFMGIALQHILEDAQIFEAMEKLNELAEEHGDILVNSDALNVELKRFESHCYRVPLHENAFDLCSASPDPQGIPSLRFQQTISMDFNCTELQKAHKEAIKYNFWHPFYHHNLEAVEHSILLIPSTHEQMDDSQCNCEKIQNFSKTDFKTLISKNISCVHAAATEVFVQCWTSGTGMGGVDRFILQAQQELAGQLRKS